MSKLLVRKDLQSDLKRNVNDIVKEIEGDDLKVVVFMENTEPPVKVKPKVIKFEPTVTLLRKLAKEGQIEKGVAKIMFYSPSTGRSKGLTPNMMAGFQYIEPGTSTTPHSHNMASIYLVVKGEGYSEIDGEIFKWGQGDIFVVPANAVHSHTNSGKEEAILFDVTDSGLLENMGILEFKEKE
ncbi:MAG: cupin domain-containing protein [Metallosphaera sp.]|uniref:Cupin 2 domain-containing protein n=1 Tax=Metallosphaera cuprina (strain Ar-4) TaxID=1006006 RepID=F4FZ91_METCR|nr:cupin domain-containing protein [Metallosphaera cuprina]AEB94400.1 cupin 2 domain-containing protein [Metallosphaera cuprina Ar-4]